MARPYDIVGYTYRASLYCGTCVVDALPTGEGEKFDGWKVAEGVTISTENNLAEIAEAFGIDRMDESSFDSEDFPKVVFRDSCEDEETCEECGAVLD